jgi:ketol-acid reductoisomerase
MKLAIDPQPFPFRLTGARIAVLGYGPTAAQQARGLRDAGNEVSVGVRSGGMSCVRARRDGFVTGPACSVIAGAKVVVVLVPDDEQASVYWHAIEPNVDRDALLVFGRALALETRAFEPRGMDAVFVATHERTCRVAVHHDATGRALERAISVARAAFGPDVTVATTTTATEAEVELATLETRAGGAAAFRSEVEAAAALACDSHAPDEARIAYYEGLRALVEERARRRAAPAGGDRGSVVSRGTGHGPVRGMP